jgi:hypothetical protein
LPTITKEITNLTIPPNIPFFTIGNHSRRLPKVNNVNLYTITFIGHNKRLIQVVKFIRRAQW